MEKITIEVLGSGCKKCSMLFDLAREVAQEMVPDAAVLYSTDVTRIVALGLVNSPVLTINGKPVLVGVLPERDKLVALFQGYSGERN
jgi:hypothetical protein